jgi:signal transduction histidine kinase
MDITTKRRWFYGLTVLWMVMLLGLGSWWLYLVFKLHTTLITLNIPELGPQGKFLNMMKWEGSFFFIFLTLLGISLFIMYYRDLKKTKAMQAFFSSLSHELKTPLASMRLQTEVIKDVLQEKYDRDEQLSSLTKRLIEDTHKLESEFEKTLQLSRIEQDAQMTLVPIGLERYLKRQGEKYLGTKKLSLNISENAQEILADELSLNMIFRNLFENTLRHNPSTDLVTIYSVLKNNNVVITYDDHGKKFAGNLSHLGELFYKFNSTKGSGIGLYLIKNLMRKMKGACEIKHEDRLIFKLTFKNGGQNV